MKHQDEMYVGAEGRQNDPMERKGYGGAEKIRRAPSRRRIRTDAILFYGCICLLILSVVFLLAFMKEHRAYEKAEQYYETLADQVTQNASQNVIFSSRVNFAPLNEENPDIAAWLSIPGLSLSLPVTWCGDNQTYLHKAFDGSENRNGCLFLSAKATPDFSGCYQLIYGHHIHSGSMFGSLANYKDADFWEKYPTFSLYTPQGDYTCTIFSCYNTVDQTDVYRVDWKQDEDYAAFLKQIGDASLYDTGVNVPDGAHVLTLSTCDSPYSGQNKRFVVHAVMEKMSGM